MTRICHLTEISLGLPAALTIGVFDGVHRGHQALIGHVIERARAMGGQSTVLTFHPHPRTVLAPDALVYELTSWPDRLKLLAAAGVDVVATLTFTVDISHLLAEQFLDLVQKHINVRELWVGEDFALGYRRSRTVARLRELGAERGFTVGTVAPVEIGGVRASSSRIRELIAAGDVDQATQMLGRHPRLEGVVITGERRGRTLGFPTANLALTTNYLLPANGIYAVYAEIDGRLLPAVANIGVRPTFGVNDRLVEVFVLDYDGDLYGQRLGVQIVKRLRDELRFASVGALIAQMHADVDIARAVLAGSGRGAGD